MVNRWGNNIVKYQKVNKISNYDRTLTMKKGECSRIRVSFAGISYEKPMIAVQFTLIFCFISAIGCYAGKVLQDGSKLESVLER